MAAGRTVSANYITEKDGKIIALCEQISKILINAIIDKNAAKEFYNDFAKISETRDGGAGRGGGKLQRDALCTRGRQGKAPFSNRNLRWHPLVVAAESSIQSAKEIDAIEIEGEDESQTLIFIVNSRRYPSEKVHALPQRYAALPKHWFPHIDKLKYWSDNLWTQNSCVIPALEACNWEDAVETYAALGIAIAVEIYKADFDSTLKNIAIQLTSQQIDKQVTLPSKDFPSNKKDIVSCPMCKVVISQNAANIPNRIRIPVWQPAWRSTKRGEGEDSSIQIMHMMPLVDKTMNHIAKNVRYGHRWCNVSMTDHSLDETLDFMEYIVKAHNRCR